MKRWLNNIWRAYRAGDDMGALSETGALYGRLKRLVDHPTAVDQHYTEALDTLTGHLGFAAKEAKAKLVGTTGTALERVQQALTRDG